MAGDRTPSRERRVDGWGWTDERTTAPAALVAWLVGWLGEPIPSASRWSPSLPAPAPRPLPAFPTPVVADAASRVAHARGQGLPDLVRMRSGALPRLPDGVAFPASGDEVAGVLSASRAAGVRVIPWGGGTSVTGGVNVPDDDRPTVSLDLSRLSGLLALDPVSGHAELGAGTRGPAIEAALAPYGLTLGHLPQSWELSTLGGWIVTRSSGQESSGYGRIEDMVAGAEVVTPTGVIDLAAQPAAAAGPDLRQLVLGSEGRLGVVTRATVRVAPAPEGKEVRGWMMPSFARGLAACRALAGSGLPLALVRLSDETETRASLLVGLGSGWTGRAARAWLDLRGVERGALVLVGAHGSSRRRRALLGAAGEVVGAEGAVSLGRRPGDRWLADRFRHPYLRDALLDLGIATETLETSAPWSALPRVREALAEALGGALAEAGERTRALAHVSHLYRDGASLYVTFFFRAAASADETIARWRRLKTAATDALLRAGGTLSHHHGVGAWHAPWLERATGPAGRRLLAAAAAALDPDATINPHVLLAGGDRLDA